MFLPGVIVVSVKETLMHRSVLLTEVVELLDIKPGGTYVDCTVGSGGHAEAILERLGRGGLLLGLDRDTEALARSAERLAHWGPRCVLEHANFADLAQVAADHGLEQVDGVLADLGMSSEQVDEGDRGFSFRRDGPLDMRMDRTRGETAAEHVARASEGELLALLRDLGEEPEAKSVARAIVAARRSGPVTTTRQLADIVEGAKRGRRGKIHPATQTFMALRMAVNQELESLEQALQAALRLVRPGGRIALITFHSIEDRLVKRCFARHIGRWESLAAGGRRWVGEQPAVERVNRKPVRASEDEGRANPRARSAKLRVVKRLR